MTTWTIGSLFTGIEGLERGLEELGLGPVIWQAENDPHALAVLESVRPDVMRCGDILLMLEADVAGKLRKLTEADAAEAVRLYDGGDSIGIVAARFAVTRQAMWSLLKRRTTLRPQQREGAANHFYRGGVVSDPHVHNVTEKAIASGKLIRALVCETVRRAWATVHRWSLADPGPPRRLQPAPGGSMALPGMPPRMASAPRGDREGGAKGSPPLERDMRWLPVSPARTSARPGKVPASTASGPGSGASSLASFAFFDRRSSSWKTSQRSLGGDWTGFSETLPRSGTMRSGRLFARPMSERPTYAIESSCWPTPTASEYGSSQNGCNGIGGEFERPSANTPSLWTIARTWPTPTAAIGERGPTTPANALRRRAEHRVPIGLQEMATWPTPMARDGDPRRGTPSAETATARIEDGRRNLEDVVAATQWPTPRATDADRGGRGDLVQAARGNRNPHFWPTPTASIGTDGNAQRGGARQGELLLPGMARAMAEGTWPTPTAHDAATPKTPEQIEAMKARAPKRTGGGPPGVRNLNEVATSWPTPMAADSGRASGTFARGNPTLTGAARDVFPTPRASDATRGAGESAEREGGPSLLTVAREIWPTPTAADSRSGGSRNLDGSAAHPGVSLTDAVTSGTSTASRRARTRSPDGMVLNPRFVEAMMGFPDGHTASAYLGTPASRAKRPSPSTRSRSARRRSDPKSGT